MNTNEWENGKYQQVLESVIVTCKSTQDEVSYLREECYNAVTKLYWMSVRMSNHGQVFSTEQLEEAEYLYRGFSELADMCDDIMKQMEEIETFLYNLKETFPEEGICGSAEDLISNFAQRYKTCKSQMEAYASKQQELKQRIDVFSGELKNKEKGICRFRRKGLYGKISKIYRSVSNNFRG